MAITEAFTASRTTTRSINGSGNADTAPVTGAVSVTKGAATGAGTGLDAGTGTGTGTGGTGSGAFQPVPVWFFAFDGLLGAAYDIAKSYPHAWIVPVAGLVVNIVVARTVLRGRLKMAKAMLKGRRTRKIALGLIALRVAVHLMLGAVGMEATSGIAHLALAAGMCGTTVALLAFDQRVMLRSLNA
jgi:hypothetical protein